jgi:hypothetical protein
MSLQSLVFVHGAWHGPEHWEPLATVLRKEGFSCFTPLLDFCGSEHSVDCIASSIHQIQQILETETSVGRNVVVINYLFRACVGCSSVKGFTKKDPSRLSNDFGYVVGIIQLCAFMPPLWQSLYNVVSPYFEGDSKRERERRGPSAILRSGLGGVSNCAISRKYF